MLRFSLGLACASLWIALGPLPTVLAAPLFTKAYIQRRTDANLAVLQFAGILEQLESQFYAQALAKFTPDDFTQAGYVSSQLVIDQLNVVAADESSHVSIIESTIVSAGAIPEGAKCQFDFTTALTDVPTVIATARTLELVGVGAYLGGATLLDSKNVLTAAGQILTIEARHSSLLNTLAGGQFQSSAFDSSLTPPSVLALAGGFLKGGCDPVAATGITPGTALEVSSSTTVLGAGSALSFAIGGQPIPPEKGFCQMVVGGAPSALAFPLTSCHVPENLFGPVFLYVTSDATPLQTNINQQDASKITAGPTLVFVDPPSPELLAQSIKNIAPPPAGGDPSPTPTETAPPDAPSSGTGSNPGTQGSEGSGDIGVTVLHMPE